MRASRLAAWLLPVSVRRYRSALIIGALSVGLFGFVAQWAGQAATTGASDSGGLGSAALRTIQVDSYGGSQDPQPVNGPALIRMSQLPHVSDAQWWDVAQVAPTGESASDLGVVLGLAPRIAAVQRPLAAGREPAGDLEVVLPASVAASSGVAVGGRLPIEYTEMSADGTGQGRDATLAVVGTWDDSVPGIDDPHSAYTTPATVARFIAAARGTSPEWVEERFVHARAYLTVEELADVVPTVEALRSQGYGASSLTTLLTSASSTQEFLGGVRLVLGVTVTLLLTSLAWSTASSILVARRGEFGLLRAVGWQLSEVRLTFALQLAALGAVVGAGGAVVGVVVRLLAGAVGDQTVFGTPLGMPWSNETVVWVLAPLLAAALVFVAAGAPMVRKLAKVEPDEVLRDLVR